MALIARFGSGKPVVSRVDGVDLHVGKTKG